MSERLGVLKTYKLYIDGQFPRSESGRAHPVTGLGGVVIAHVAKGSRKDLRDAVEAARKAQPGWAGATAYLRGQIMYRMAEMMEGKREEFAEALQAAAASKQKQRPARKNTQPARTVQADEVSAAIDRLVHYAGWSDKYAQVLGCNNPVAGPYYNFTVMEPTGVVGVVAPDEAPLLSLVSLLAPAICAGNTVVAIASLAQPLAAAVLGEVFATSDLPHGVVNILTADRTELLGHLANHREVDAIHAANLTPEEAAVLRSGAAENIKRVTVRAGVDWYDVTQCQSPHWIEAMVEAKTVWHPAAV